MPGFIHCRFCKALKPFIGSDALEKAYKENGMKGIERQFLIAALLQKSKNDNL